MLAPSAASFDRLTGQELKALHVSILGRDTGVRGRFALETSLRRRRTNSMTTLVVKGTQSSTFRGLRLSWKPPSPRCESESVRRPMDGADGNPVSPNSARKRASVIATSSVPTLLALMHINTSENQAVREQLSEFCDAPSNNIRMWAEACNSMHERLTTPKYVRVLCVGFSDSHSAPNEAVPNEGKYVDYQRTVDAKRAEWVLSQRFERGPSYLTDMWKGLNKLDMASTCDGYYFIHNTGTLRVEYCRRLRRSRLRDRVKNVRDSVAARTRVPAPEKDADDVDEIFEGLGEGDEQDVPSLHLTFEPSTGLFHFSLSLSTAQHSEMMQLRSNPDALTSSSPMLFRGIAGCVGVDRWLVVTDGPWRNKLIEFVRRKASADKSSKRPESMDVESVLVDGIAFAKRVAAPCTKLTDPFLCTVCGAERCGNNFVYATRSGDLRRGMYQCAVCETATLHVSKLTDDRSSRPRWQTVTAVLREPALGLAHFPFDQ